MEGEYTVSFVSSFVENFKHDLRLHFFILNP
jgi:hypothetical protein